MKKKGSGLKGTPHYHLSHHLISASLRILELPSQSAESMCVLHVYECVLCVAYVHE